MVKPSGGEYEVLAPITMTGVTGALHIFAYGESQGGVQQSINAGQDTVSKPFAYSARYLLYVDGYTSAETMRDGWGTDYVYQAQGTVAHEDSVYLVSDITTAPTVTISEDGLSAGYNQYVRTKSAIRANQGMQGEFRYWEAHRHRDPINMGFGLINPFAVIDEYCCVSDFLTGAPPSMSLNALTSIWRNLVNQANFDTDNEYYGYAVDYRGSRPIVYVILAEGVVHEMTMDDFITPIYPMLYGNTLGSAIANSANFGTTPFQFDARQALIDYGVDVTDFAPGWGPYQQNLHLAAGEDAAPSLTYTATPATGSTGNAVSFSATATDAEDGSLTAQISWRNNQTADTATGGSYSFTPTVAGLYKITAAVSDSSGQTYAESVMVEVSSSDVGSPVVTPPSDLIISLGTGNSVPATFVSIVNFLAGASAVDDVDGNVAVTHNAPASFPLGDTVVTFSATDSSDNTGVATATVTVNDIGLPVVSAPADLVVGASFSNTLPATDTAIAAFLAGASALDGVDGAVDVSNSAPDNFPIGETLVEFSAEDAAGNIGTATATVTVNDTGLPVVTAPSNLMVSTDSADSVPVTNAAIAQFLAAATVTDVVDESITYTHNAPANFPIDETTVTFSATDAAGNTSTASATVTVNDSGEPVVTVPGNIILSLSSGSTLAATSDAIAAFLAAASANDSVDGVLTVSNDAPANFPVDTTTVTFSATDTAGNTGQASATVTVNDTGEPVITTPVNLAITIDSGTTIPASNTAIAAFLAGATAVDDVDGALTVTHDAPGTFPLGVTPVSFSATDSAGNIGTTIATVSVSDAGSPVITVPADLILTVDTVNSLAASNSSIAGFLAAATALDDIDGSVSVTNNAPAVFPVGETIVTFSALDSANNLGRATASVTLVDTGAPVITVPNDLVINILSGSSVSIDNAAIRNFLLAASATDIVDGNVSVTHNAPLAFPIGDSVVTFSATDAEGNSANTPASVTVAITGVAPLVNITIEQGGAASTTVTSDGGLVTISAAVSDANEDDSHSYDWSQTSAGLIPQGGITLSTYIFDPESVSAGFYSLDIIVVDDSADALSGHSRSVLQVISRAPELSATEDSDGDGTSDSNEGINDADNDRIPDYLDDSDQA
ncbi:MAG: HYR domain-containing protein, partial [Spongiibacteraceae bacterium]|nr:HYR domain-containing protein [Spongiibacteraceae bacterium]